MPVSGIRLLAAAVAFSGAAIALSILSNRPSIPNEATLRAEYAKVWSGRPDGALDFRLTGHPDARYLLVPPDHYDPSKRYELWVTLHGIAGTAEDGLSEWYHLAKHRGVFLLSPHGANRNKRDPKASYWKPERDARDIAKMIDEVSTRYAIDRSRIAMFGTSEGSTLGWRVVAENPGLIWFVSSFGVYLGESLPEGIDADAFRKAATGTAMFYARGEADERFDRKEFDTTQRRLTDLGFKLRAMTLKEAGHDARPFRENLLRYYDELLERPPDRWHVPLKGPWRARFVTKLTPLDSKRYEPPFSLDPGISAEAKRYVKPDFDDQGWQTADVPKDWDRWPGDWKRWDGEAVLRKEVEVPTATAGRDLWLHLGQIDDYDDTYFNGVVVGRSTKDTPFFWSRPRIYRIPGKLVRPGRNIVAVRAFDMFGGGGIFYSDPADLVLSDRP